MIVTYLEVMRITEEDAKFLWLAAPCRKGLNELRQQCSMAPVVALELREEDVMELVGSSITPDKLSTATLFWAIEQRLPLTTVSLCVEALIRRGFRKLLEQPAQA